MNVKQRAAVGAAVIATMATGAVAGVTLFGSAAGAQTATTTPAATSSPAPGMGQPPAWDPSKGGHTANGITEALLTGDTATKVSDAAEAAVPGATIDRVETDAEGAAYEAHMTKADGSKVTVKVNADFSVKGIEAGM